MNYRRCDQCIEGNRRYPVRQTQRNRSARTVTCCVHAQVRQAGEVPSHSSLRKIFSSEARQSKLERVVQKIQEWIISVRLERRYTKEEIVAMYFNTVDFSSNAYGIKSASQTYFGKNPSQLNLQESALLVGMLQGAIKLQSEYESEELLQREEMWCYRR